MPVTPPNSPKRLPSWPAGLSGSQGPVLAQSLAALVGHLAYDTHALRADLHRFAFLLGITDGEETLRRANTMTANKDTVRPLTGSPV
jgi:hypothetical protein